MGFLSRHTEQDHTDLDNWPSPPSDDLPPPEHLDHRIGHGCKPCREIRREGPNLKRDPLGVLPERQGGEVVPPPKDKRALRNEARREARKRAGRLRLLAAIRAA